MHCERQMVLGRLKYPEEERTDYQNAGMASTGTHRHADIQTAMLNSENEDWLYVNPVEWLTINEDNIPHKLEILNQDELETRFYCDELKISFQCDGIIYNKKNKQYYLFEFKNKMSFATKEKYLSHNDSSGKPIYKYKDYDRIHDKHIGQISLYCYLLGIDRVIYQVENRDTCYLLKPIIKKITKKQMKEQIDKIKSCERHIENGTFPPAQREDLTYCRSYCPYLKECRSIGY